MMTSTIFMMLGLIIAADAPAKDAVAKELKKLEGNWIVVCVKEGVQISPSPLGQDEFLIYRIKGTTVTCPDQSERTLHIIPQKKPKTFDLLLGNDTLFGIYEWDSEWLKVNYERVERDRPKNFQWAAILARDSKEEREAANQLAEALPLGNAKSKAKCRVIIRKHPKMVAAMIAEDFLDYGLLIEEELNAAKEATKLLEPEAAKLLEGAQKGPKEKGREIYLDILEKYPKTKSAKEAKRLLDELNASRQNKEAAKLLDLAKEGPEEKAKERYLEILKRYPETPAAWEAKNLFDRLAAASRKLKYAKMFAEDGVKMNKGELIEKARVHCREIIEKYPETKAAKQAQGLLDKLSK
jgi:uncharacterized protein (TIGR03067 family)